MIEVAVSASVIWAGLWYDPRRSVFKLTPALRHRAALNMPFAQTCHRQQTLRPTADLAFVQNLSSILVMVVLAITVFAKLAMRLKMAHVKKLMHAKQRLAVRTPLA